MCFSQASSRGIKNAYSVEQKKKKQEELEKRIAASGSGGEGGLRVSLKKKQRDATVHICTEKILFCCLQDWITCGRTKRKGKGIEMEACVVIMQCSRCHFWARTARMAESLFPPPALLPLFLHLWCISLTVLSALGTSSLSWPDPSVHFQYWLRLSLFPQSL